MKSAAALAMLGVLGACAPDARMPESSYQWERRQERIEREWRADQAKAPAQTPNPGATASKDRP